MTKPARSTPARSSSVLITGLGLAVLVFALGIQFAGQEEETHVPRNQSLSSLLPLNLGEWRGVDVPLGSTEAVQDSVTETLRFDEAVQRSYRKGETEFTVYIAYWQPGKMPAREVGRHIPDVCWPAAGWKRREADTAFVCRADDLTLKSGQYRRFEHASTQGVLHVLYWHVYKGEVILYNPLGPPGDWSLITDLFRKGLRQRGEQYFIRLSSNRPLQQLQGEEFLKQILAVVGELGLKEAN